MSSPDTVQKATAQGASLLSLPKRADVIVIGGGIAGSAAAHRLALRGVDVLLLEKGEIASEQSGRNQGFVRQQLRDPLEMPLIMASNKIWRRMADELDADIEWVQGGNLGVALDEKTLEAYRTWNVIAREFGLDTRLVGSSEVGELLRGLAPKNLGAIFTPSDGQADPEKTTRAIAEAARRAGARVVTGCTVINIVQAGGRVIGVDTSLGSVSSGVVICAAGIWTHKLLKTVGQELPQQVVTATVARTNPVARVTDAATFCGRTSFRQAPSGAIVLGGANKARVDVSVESFRHLRMFFPMFIANRDRFQLRLGPRLRSLGPSSGSSAYRLGEPPFSRTNATAGLSEFTRLFPGLGPMQLVKIWGGRIEGTPDALPVLDALQKPQGLIVGTGQSNHGFAMGPIFGVVLADLATRGASDFDLKPFRLSRFAEGDFGRPHAIV